MKDPADAAAWSVFFGNLSSVVYRLARSRGLQDADADDLAQQVFVSISRSVASWAPAADGATLSSLLYRIAHNEISKRLRAGNRTWQPFMQCSGNAPRGSPTRFGRERRIVYERSRMEAFRWASDAIRHEFTAATWTMFWQSTVEEQTVDDVAKTHGRTSGAVYLARYRVMKRLKEKIDEVSELWSEFT